VIPQRDVIEIPQAEYDERRVINENITHEVNPVQVNENQRIQDK